ncbi:nucleosome assembly protein, putative [Ichthyophthirius multifiliis]|uniref:Nucleosome assembly protein, putative n=1 Tax=Ichthyophthirius multifiliis TaxID=5932 RepID=G0R450_ICHMU|nr:nucleosome assembly protein, putative [Ichthyophthirius multifiliis]EGR27750.1 nucleosome assembly protein, putative [Ichthyophthirius multifiliis]|eukprot:XP_004025202.1 nucleosome assembly protein, putative [Ichthyophthirius multifiliis]
MSEITESQELICGKYPNPDEINDIENFTNEEERKELQNLQTEQEINEYWYKAMYSNNIVSQEIKDQDIPVLKTLKRIEYIPLEVYKYQLIFHFKPNEYFTNTLLVKTFEIDDEDEPIKSTGTSIDWKQGKNTTIKIEKKTQKSKKTGTKRIVERVQKYESFFNFFNDSYPLSEDSDDDNEKNQRSDVDRLNIDFDIFKSLIDEVIPYSIEYFLGVKSGEESLDLDDENEFEDQQCDEYNKNQENQKKKSKGVKNINDKQECKQQ